MGSALPQLTADQFLERLSQLSVVAKIAAANNAFADLDAFGPRLYSHYLELRRWNPRLSLVGPGTADEIVERHYGESLAALQLLGRSDQTVMDLGSGGGFPGFVLAAAIPSLDVTLVEPSTKKWSFLQTVNRVCGLSCQNLNVRVEVPSPESLPAELDLITSRALAISSRVLEHLGERSPAVRFLLWTGEKFPTPPTTHQVGRRIHLPGSAHRQIVEFVPRGSSGHPEDHLFEKRN